MNENPYLSRYEKRRVYRNYIGKIMHRPGLEPGFRRWQRLVMTTTLSMHVVLSNVAFKII